MTPRRPRRSNLSAAAALFGLLALGACAGQAQPQAASASPPPPEGDFRLPAGSDAKNASRACRHPEDAAPSTLAVVSKSTRTISADPSEDPAKRPRYEFKVAIEAPDAARWTGVVDADEGRTVPASVRTRQDYLTSISVGGGVESSIELVPATAETGVEIRLSAVRGPFGPELTYFVHLSDLVRFDKRQDGSESPCVASGFAQGVMSVAKDAEIVLPIQIGGSVSKLKLSVREIPRAQKGAEPSQPLANGLSGAK